MLIAVSIWSPNPSKAPQFLGFRAGCIIVYHCVWSWASYSLTLPRPQCGIEEDLITTLSSVTAFYKSLAIYSIPLKAWACKWRGQAFEMQLMWENKKPSNWCSAGSEFYVLCEVINRVLALGLFQVALGFCISGFFGGNCSHCRKVGVNLYFGHFPGHSLAKSWQLHSEDRQIQWPYRITHTLH